MQGHLPECPYRVDHPTLPRNRGLICICGELRACEQRVLNRVRADERKRAVFIAQHSIEDSYCREDAIAEDAIAWIDGVTPKWWTGNQP